MPSNVKITRFDAAGNVISIESKAVARNTAKKALADKIASGKIKEATCLYTPWQAAERLVVVNGCPAWLVDDDVVVITESDARKILAGRL